MTCPFEITFEVLTGGHGDLEVRYGHPFPLLSCQSVSRGHDIFDLKHDVSHHTKSMNICPERSPDDR